MRSRGAILREVPGTWEIVDLEVDDPRPGEIRIKMIASGLCHSDDHMSTGDLPAAVLPVCGGHEGAGIVESVGPNTPGFVPGDKVIFSFLPACGKCRWCSTGHQNLCDLGAFAMIGSRWDDPASFRLKSADGTPVAQALGISTFSEYTTISAHSAVKVPEDTPLDKAVLLGCAVGTGWGSAVHSGKVCPGDTVIVMGIGGVGANAVQGARHAGAAEIIAVDPNPFKRDTATEVLGATHAVETMDEATDLAKSCTNGQGADVAIITVGVITGDHIGQAFAAVSKRGTVVVTALGNIASVGIPVSIPELTLYEKKIVGSLFGSSNPNADIPTLLSLYRSGSLKLDELITTEYALDDITKGFEDMHAGVNIRGVVRF
ncbi:NDMA-dependent alcohol dehydrogenase [Amycolatopsis thermoflava]|uniref:NDMA-dependent alcohol dehydrogenase n=1 Tax=Amycolatopsis thermoflava TaxID=84480 RepID=UPI0004076A7A|nr:NDMA-dependent alcohol dehydrogenase [Amycolatopsis thermoflava]